MNEYQRKFNDYKKPNEYQEEFKKVFYYLREVFSDYNRIILSNNNIPNPFSDTNYSEIFEKLSSINADQEYIDIMNSFIISLHEGHAYMVNPNKKDNSKMIPLIIQYYEGKYYVIKSGDESLIGSEVTSIDGIDIDGCAQKTNDSFSFDNGKCYSKRITIDSDTSKKIVCDGNSIELKPVYKNEFYGLISSREKVNGDNIVFNFINGVPYLRINSFSHGMINQDTVDMLSKISRKLNDNNAEDLIIDIRDNKGGSDEWYQLLSLFSDKDYTYDYSLNSIVGNISSNECNRLLNGLGENIDSSIERLKGDKKQISCFNGIKNGNSTIKNRYLMINDGNYSVSDTLAKIANKTGFATTVGKHTSGDGLGITPYSFTTNILSRNNISVRIPSTFSNLNEFQTKPSIEMEEGFLMPYEYGTSLDTELYNLVSLIKSKTLIDDNSISMQ